MRLPSIQYSKAVGTGGMISPFLPIAVGNAQARAASQVSGAAKSWENFNYSIEERNDRLDEAEVKKQHASNMGEFETNIQSTPEIRLDDIPPEVIKKLNIRNFTMVTDKNGISTKVPRDTVPSYEVYAELKKTAMEESRDSSSSYFRNNNLRNAWVADTDIMIEQQYGLAKVRGVQMGIDHIKIKQDDAFKRAVVSGNTPLAISIVDDMMYQTEDYKNDLKLEANKSGEVNTYLDIMEESNFMTLELAMRTVALENDEYTGWMSDPERHEMYNKLNTQMKRSLADAATKEKVDNSILEDDARKIIDRNSNSYGVDKTFASDTLLKLQSLPEDQRDKVLERKLAVSMEVAPYTTQLFNAPRGIRDSEARRAKKDLTATGAKAIMNAAIIETAESANREFDKHSLQYAKDRTEIDVQLLDFLSEDLVVNLKDRALNITSIEQQFGEPSNAAFLDQEINQLDALLSEPGELKYKLDVLGKLSEGLGKDGMLLAMDQIRDTKFGKSYTMAGELMALDKPMAAAWVLRGVDTRTNNPEIIKNMIDYEEHYDTVVGSAYGTNPTRRGDIREAALNIYATMKSLEGNFKGELDKDAFEVAIHMAMGDRAVIKYGGSNVVPSNENMTQETFENWWDNVDPEALAVFGEIDGYTNKQFMRQIRNGDVKIINAGNEEFMFYNLERNTAIYGKDSNELFIMTMDEAVPMYAEPNETLSIREYYKTPEGIAELEKGEIMRAKLVQDIRKTADKAMESVDNVIRSMPGKVQEIHKEVRKRQKKQRESETYVDEQGRIKTRYVE